MKVIVIQKSINDVDIRSTIQRVGDKQPDIVCLGELAATGCLYQPRPVPDSETVCASLKPFEFAVMMGLPRKSNGKLYNSYLYHYKGNCQYYNKINLFEPMNELSVYQAGATPGIFETPFGRVGAAICYDLRFPEIFENLVDQNVKLIALPAAWPLVRINDWKELIVERAKACRVPIIGINSVGNDGVNEFGGCSMVVDAEGKILAQADERNESILEVEL